LLPGPLPDLGVEEHEAPLPQALRIATRVDQDHAVRLPDLRRRQADPPAGIERVPQIPRQLLPQLAPGLQRLAHLPQLRARVLHDLADSHRLAPGPAYGPSGS